MTKLREALTIARRLGLVVRYVNCTGEWSVRGHRTVLVNARRKDASQALMTLIRRAKREGRTV